MKSRPMLFSILLAIILLDTMNSSAQKIQLNNEQLQQNGVSMSFTKIDGKKVVRVVKSNEVVKVDEPTYAKINDLSFGNGIIELKVMGKLLPNAPDSARAFIGIAFRINSDDTKFESIYIRPTNGIAPNQLRRNRAVQYFSYPKFKFSDSRKTDPGVYETYADIAPNEWIKLKYVIHGAKAELFINDSKNPNLIVNDMKMGSDASGSLGLWVDIGTEGFFKDLVITKEN